MAFLKLLTIAMSQPLILMQTHLKNISCHDQTNETDKRKSAKRTQQIHKEFDNAFHGIGCFEGTVLLQLKPNSRPYQAPPRCEAYVLQKPFKDKMDRLQQLDIITPLGVDEMFEWCNSFVLVPKAKGKVRLVLDPAWLN